MHDYVPTGGRIGICSATFDLHEQTMDNSDITTGNKYELINLQETEVKVAENQLTEKAKEVKETLPRCYEICLHVMTVMFAESVKKQV